MIGNQSDPTGLCLQSLHDITNAWMVAAIYSSDDDDDDQGIKGNVVFYARINYTHPCTYNYLVFYGVSATEDRYFVYLLSNLPSHASGIVAPPQIYDTDSGVAQIQTNFTHFFTTDKTFFSTNS